MALKRKLRDILDPSTAHEPELLLLEVVHIRSASLPPSFRGRLLKAEVRYGAPWSWRCETSPVEVPKLAVFSAMACIRMLVEAARVAGATTQVGVDFGATCFFIAPTVWRRMIRIRLIDNASGEILAKASLPWARSASRAQEVHLHGAFGSRLGSITLATETQVMTRRQFMVLARVSGAEVRGDALVAELAPSVRGEVQDLGIIRV
mmetsp:Transcript_62801/g.162281  ORF Transcript_62801/g.162281 Transcript_62801/m.162281 type:complete len:206 (-) Transcript_62801:228-845(-)